eukprot:scaffold11053_cov178-Amphora_coffeaeformis.AAC.1
MMNSLRTDKRKISRRTSPRYGRGIVVGFLIGALSLSTLYHTGPQSTPLTGLGRFFDESRADVQVHPEVPNNGIVGE